MKHIHTNEWIILASISLPIHYPRHYSSYNWCLKGNPWHDSIAPYSHTMTQAIPLTLLLSLTQGILTSSAPTKQYNHHQNVRPTISHHSDSKTNSVIITYTHYDHQLIVTFSKITPQPRAMSCMPQALNDCHVQCITSQAHIYLTTWTNGLMAMFVCHFWVLPMAVKPLVYLLKVWL